MNNFPQIPGAVRVSVERFCDVPLSYSVTVFGRFHVEQIAWPDGQSYGNRTVCAIIPDWEGYDKVRRSMITRCAGSLPVVWPFDWERA